MARLTTRQRARRVLTFLMGLRTPGVAAALSPHGFTEEDLLQGMERLAAVTRGLDTRTPAVEAPLVAPLVAFQSHWFRIARHTLEHHYPAVTKRLFLNLSPASGQQAILAVQAFIMRVQAMETQPDLYGEHGSAARALLRHRGLTDERVAEAHALLERVTTTKPVQRPLITREQQQAADDALWRWYLEWSGIARTTIRNKRLLRALGYGKPQRAGEQEAAHASGRALGADVDAEG